MITAYLALKVIHVLAAIIALGANITYGFLLSRAEKQTDHLHFMLTTVQWIDRKVANPCYFIILITGLVMVWQADYGFSQLWIWLPIFLFGVIASIGIGIFSPVLKKQVDLVNSGQFNTDAYAKVRQKSTTIGIVVTLLVVLIVVLMVLKPT